MRDFVNEVSEQLEGGEGLIVLDGFDDAIVGVIYDPDKDANFVTYSVSKMIDTLMQGSGMERGEAMEFLEYNTLQPLTSNGYPMFLYDRDSW